MLIPSTYTTNTSQQSRFIGFAAKPYKRFESGTSKSTQNYIQI